MALWGKNSHVMTSERKSKLAGPSPEALFARNPVLSYETWLSAAGGPSKASRVREQAKYYTSTGRLRHLARGVYAVVPPGADPTTFLPDPYLVAAALRTDAVLSYHTALDLLGVSRSVFHRYPYFTVRPRRMVRLDSWEWPSVAHPKALVEKRRTDFGVVMMDRRGTVLRVTGPERTLADGFFALRWVGGLEELVESVAAFHDLDLDRLDAYLRLLDRAVVDAAVGWFVESHPQVAPQASAFLQRLERRTPKTAVYLGTRAPGGRMQRRWNLIVPSHLSPDTGFEGGER